MLSMLFAQFHLIIKALENERKKNAEKLFCCRKLCVGGVNDEIEQEKQHAIHTVSEIIKTHSHTLAHTKRKREKRAIKT